MSLRQQLQDTGKKLVGAQHYNKDGIISNRQDLIVQFLVLSLQFVYFYPGHSEKKESFFQHLSQRKFQLLGLVCLVSVMLEHATDWVYFGNFILCCAFSNSNC